MLGRPAAVRRGRLAEPARIGAVGQILRDWGGRVDRLKTRRMADPEVW